MEEKELNEILDKHKKWLSNEPGGECARLCSADLRGADLCCADLRAANLCGAILCGAILRDANLYGADLSGANICGAILRNTNIENISYDEHASFFELQCPEEGSFIAFKKVQDKIVKLEIPADAKRSSATSLKCRCSKAKVLGIYDFEHNLLPDKEIENRVYNHITTYKVGEMVYPDSFDEDRWNECSNGIHFFITFDMAKRY